MKKLSYICIAAGALLLLFPWIWEWQMDRQQKNLLDQTELAFAMYDDYRDDVTIEQAYNTLNELFLQQAEAGTDQQEQPLPEQTIAPTDIPVTPEPTPEPTSPPAIAVLSIDKINLKLPVLDGATEANMKYAAARMKETGTIGEIGNAAIAAHRVNTRGRLFNRLNEIEVGDEIQIRTASESITYSVFRVSLVEPTDVSVLRQSTEESIITLITCDPAVNPTHRIIVHAKRAT